MKGLAVSKTRRTMGSIVSASTGSSSRRVRPRWASRGMPLISARQWLVRMKRRSRSKKARPTVALASIDSSSAVRAATRSSRRVFSALTSSSARFRSLISNTTPLKTSSSPSTCGLDRP